MTDKNIFDISNNDEKANRLMEKLFDASKSFNDTLFLIKHLIDNRYTNTAPGSMIELMEQLNDMTNNLIASAKIIADFGQYLTEVKASTESDSVEADEVETEG